MKGNWGKSNICAIKKCRIQLFFYSHLSISTFVKPISTNLKNQFHIISKINFDALIYVYAYTYTYIYRCVYLSISLYIIYIYIYIFIFASKTRIYIDKLIPRRSVDEWMIEHRQIDDRQTNR